MGAPKSRAIVRCESTYARVLNADGEYENVRYRDMSHMELLAAARQRWGMPFPELTTASKETRLAIAEREDVDAAVALYEAHVARMSAAVKVEPVPTSVVEPTPTPVATTPVVVTPEPSPIASSPAPIATASNRAELLEQLLAGIDEPRVREIVADELRGMGDVIGERVADAIANIPPQRVEIITPTRTWTSEAREHEVFGLVCQTLSAGVNALLVGPAGSGKSTIAEHAADALGLDFHSMSVGPTLPESRIFGFIDAQGNYHRTPLREAFERGGVIVIDELDRGHAGVMTALNQLLANGVAAFPDGMVRKHEDCRIVATANTFGRGGDRMYVGANQLDAATMDRFSVLVVDYDELLERELATAYAGTQGSIVTLWVDTVQRIRSEVSAARLPIVVSPRASIDGARMLAAGIAWSIVCEARLFASWSDDNRTRFGADAVVGVR